MKNLILALLFISFLTSCTQKPNNSRDPDFDTKGFTVIDMTRKDKESLVSNIGELSCVNLQTGDNSLLSSIDKVVIIDDKIIVLDKIYSAIKVFDLNGNYLFDIGRLGTAKAEYLKLSDICYNKSHNSLLVLCNSPREIQEFSLEGKYLKKYRTDFFGDEMAIESPLFRYFYINQNISDIAKGKNILISDTSNYVKNRKFSIKSNITSVYDYMGGLYSSAEEIYYNPILSNSFYRLSKGKVEGGYTVNFGKDNIRTFESMEDISKNIHSYFFVGAYFAKSGNELAFAYNEKKKYRLAFFNTKTKRIITNHPAADVLNPIFTRSIFESNGSFICVLDARKVQPFLDKRRMDIKSRFPQIYEKLLSRDSHDNPSILIFKIKNPQS